MAKAIETLKIAIDFQDKGSQALINKLVGSLTKLQLSASGARPNIKGLRTEILAQGNASVKSVSNINAQRNALSALRDEARLGGKTFNQLTQDIKKLDAQLGKTQKARGGARQATQIAGAVISGGIFGGPEGAVGALGGAAFGGVEGAFAGAAIGATVGGVREAIGGTAEYAATIDKLKIALEGVAPNTADYNSALATARQVTEELNVPQEAAVAGITRLTAAVVGANGPVKDAETVFKNVTAAIKATGGNSEDVQGAITAMVQVFSKGKVSAEELSGQLGERLPGAVTLFAKANNLSLQELQKNLKDGTVGLNELMAFVRELGDTYGGTAQEIASSGAEAGARLVVAVNDLRIAVGDAMKDVGAGFQEGFTEFIKEITPSAVHAAKELSKALKAIGPVVLTLAKNLDVIAVSLTGALGAAAIAAIVVEIKKAVSATQALKNVVDLLNLSMLKNPIFLAAMGGALAIGGIYALTKAISEQADEVERLNRANDRATQVENATYSQGSQRVAQELGAAIRSRGAARQDLLEINKQIQALKPEIAKLGETEDSPLLYEMRELRERQRAALGTISADERTIRKLQPLLATDKELGKGDNIYDDPKTEDKGGDSAAAKALERRRDAAAELVRKLNEALGISQAQNEVEKLLAQQSKERSDLKARFAKLQKGGLDTEIQQQEKEAEGLLLQKQRADLTAQTNKLGQKTVDDITKITDKIKQKFQSDQEYKRLLAEGITPELAKQLVAINQQFAANDKLLQQRILDFQAQLDKTELSEQEIKNIEEQIRLLEEKRKLLGETANAARVQVTDLQTETSNFETFKNTFKSGIEEMGNLYENLGNAAASAFSGMADVVADFVTTGKANFKEFAQSVLADLSRIFIRMAFFQAFQGLGLFSNGGVVNKGTTPPTTLPGSVGAVAAKGLAVGKNGILPFAKGGIVTKPTLFKYADGGSGRFGLMGEAGSEAIMPLRRGRNGKLGVESSGGVGNVVVNVDASGSSVEGDQPSAKLLGAVIGAAVQSELIKQKRPGGLLS